MWSTYLRRGLIAVALALVAVVLGLSAPNPVGAQVPDTAPTPVPDTTPDTTGGSSQGWPGNPYADCAATANWTITSDGIACDPDRAPTPQAPLVVESTALPEDAREWLGVSLALRFIAALATLGLAIKRLMFD